MSQPFSLTSRVPSLDGIRGTAILIVIIYHWIFQTSLVQFLPYTVKRLGLMGWSGVDLFFVLSGFLIGGILLDNKEAINYYKVFYVRRFYRIIPLYFFLVAVSATLLAASPYILDTSPHQWLFGRPIPIWIYPLFLQNIWMSVENTWGSRMIDATWSLAVEEQFYLSLPIIIRIVRQNRLPIVLLFGILAAPILRIILFFWLGADKAAIPINVLLPTRMDALLLGVLAAWYVRLPEGIESLRRYKSLIMVLAVFCAAIILYLSRDNVSFKDFYLISFGLTTVSIFYLCLLLLAVSCPEGLVAKVFQLKGLTFIGILAYGMYLFHQPILGLSLAVTTGSNPQVYTPLLLPLTLLSFCVLVIVSYFSWVFFEKKLVYLGHGFKYKSIISVQQFIRKD